MGAALGGALGLFLGCCVLTTQFEGGGSTPVAEGGTEEAFGPWRAVPRADEASTPPAEVEVVLAQVGPFPVKLALPVARATGCLLGLFGPSRFLVQEQRNPEYQQSRWPSSRRLIKQCISALYRV